MTADLPRRLAAEALGTAFLVATVVGSGIMGERLAGGNQAVALLGNTIATGAMLVVLITVFGPVSGAHFNPAVTLTFVMRRALAPGTGALYAAVQVAGGVAGALLAHAMFDLPLIQAGVHARTGAAQWLAEGVATGGLVITIFGSLRARPEAVPLAVGLYITAAYWFTASTSFANPAVTVARALTASFSGIRPEDAPMFVVAQFAAAVAAASAWRWMDRPA